MSPRAFAVTLPIALAAWLASFSAGCSGENAPAKDAIAPASPAGSVGIRYVTYRVHPDTDFKRISEYFTGEENQGGDVVMYSDPSDRRGLYFMVALDRFDKLPSGVVAVLEYVSSEEAKPLKKTFLLPAASRYGIFRELRLGVTGKDWPATNPKVVAWKISLRDKETDTLMASAQSFLWALPERSVPTK